MHNSNTYKQFKKVYKEIMSGEEFNPYYEINLILTSDCSSKRILPYFMNIGHLINAF